MESRTNKNIIIILGCSIIAKILSYIWEALLAAKLGVTDKADALYMTTSIYNILYPILDEGIWKVFLPKYKGMLANDDYNSQSIANKSISIFAILSIGLVLLLIFLPNLIVSIMAPGFQGTKKEITVSFLKMASPTYLLMSTSSIIGAMLQCHGRFFGSQLREIGTHVSKIIFFLIFYKHIGISAAVLSMIIGSLFRLIVQIPFINWKWNYRFDFHFADDNMIQMIKALPSVSLTAAILSINSTIDKVIATNSFNGSVASLNYASKLINLFSGMISLAVGTAIYPNIVQFAVKKEHDKISALLLDAFNKLIVLIVPISLFCIFNSNEIVSTAFQRGLFDSSATQLTSSVFLGYSIGMIFTGLTSIITNVFYSFGETKEVLLLSIIEMILNVIIDLILYKPFEMQGLAVGTSLVAFILLGIRLIYLKKYVHINYRNCILVFCKTLIASVLSILFVKYAFMSLLTISNRFVSLGVCIVIYMITFVGAAVLFRLSTMNIALNAIIKKKKRK